MEDLQLVDQLALEVVELVAMVVQEELVEEMDVQTLVVEEVAVLVKLDPLEVMVDQVLL